MNASWAVYFFVIVFVSEDTSNESIEHSLNEGSIGNVMVFLERIIRAPNNFTQSFMMIPETEEEMK